MVSLLEAAFSFSAFDAHTLPEPRGWIVYRCSQTSRDSSFDRVDLLHHGGQGRKTGARNSRAPRMLAVWGKRAAMPKELWSLAARVIDWVASCVTVSARLDYRNGCGQRRGIADGNTRRNGRGIVEAQSGNHRHYGFPPAQGFLDCSIDTQRSRSHPLLR